MERLYGKTLEIKPLDYKLNKMNVKQLNLCFVGNMLGKNPGYITTQGQIVADLFAEDGCKVTCVSSKINKVSRLSEIIRTLIWNRRKFDIVLLEVYSGMNFIVANVVGLFCKLFKLPLIMVLHGGNLPQFIKKYPRWTKFAFNQADALVAPSSFLAEQIGKNDYKVQVISNVIDIGKYQFRERSKISPKLLWMRSFHPIYNPEMAIKVLKRLCQRGQDATLTMAGKDKGLESGLKKMAEDLGLSDRIRFVGFLDEEQKLKEFAEADVYINTNRIDNMPVSVVEARALGLPVVSTDVGGLPYLIEHKENGLLVPDDDFNSMVKSVESLIDHPELTQKISINGRKLAENAAWSKVQREWENLILKTIENKFAVRNKPGRYEGKMVSKEIGNKI